MSAHDTHVIVDCAPTNGMANAVFKGFKGYAEVEAMLHEGFSGGVIANALKVFYTRFGGN